jgi:acetate kinase
MREVLDARKSRNERASLAFDMYVHRLRSGIGAMAAVLGGIDALVFTAGVGENSSEVRAAVCDQLAFLGLRIDPAKNAQSLLAPKDTDISTPDAAVRVLVIHAQEDWMIARQCWELVKAQSKAVS